jgi:hypothetical protein
MRQTSELATEEALRKSLPDSIYTLMRTFSSKAGLSTWNFIMPILSLSSILPGAKASVDVSAHPWNEVILLWCLVVAFSSIGKTPAYKRIRGVLVKAEEAINYRIKSNIIAKLDPANKMTPGQLNNEFEEDLKSFQPISFLAKSATIACLHQEIKNSRNYTKCYFLEEAYYFFGLLDCYKKGDSDRTQIFSLKSGSGWDRETLNRPNSSMPFTHFAPTGFLQPGPMKAKVSRKPNDGFTNRFICAFVPGVFDHLGEFF